MKVLGTGLRGLVGSRIVELLKDRYQFEASDVDITDKSNIAQKIRNSDARIVLHLAAKTDVDGCEEEKVLGENGDAWKINVEGTRNVVDACEESNKKLIYISTDFVFDGEKEVYTEDDIPNPVNWYAKTKYEGEKIVQKSSTPWVIARIAYPYRSKFEKLDFVRAILRRLQNNEKVTGVTDHKFCPTFIDDIAIAIDALVKRKEEGLFHIVGSQSLSPFDAASEIASEFGLNKDLIDKTTRMEYFKNRANRPFTLSLKNDKIKRLGVKMRGFEEGIKEVHKQISSL